MTFSSSATAITVVVFLSLILILPQFTAAADNPYTEPAVKCSDYFGVVSVKDETSQSPTISNKCGYLKTLEIDMASCEWSGGNFPPTEYVTTQFPVCGETMEGIAIDAADIIGPIDMPVSLPVAGVECPGAITNVVTDVDLSTKNIDITTAFANTGKKTCSYKVCVFGTEKTPEEVARDNLAMMQGLIEVTAPDAICNSPLGMLPPFLTTCMAKELTSSAIDAAQAAAALQNPTQIPGQSSSTPTTWKNLSCSEPVFVPAGGDTSATISSDKGWANVFKFLTGDWSLQDINRRFKVELVSTTSGKDVIVHSRTDAVCLDNVLKLCTTSDGAGNVEYGVIYADLYGIVASEDLGNNKMRFWTLDKIKYTLMDVADCIKADSSESDTSTETKFYTIADNDAFRFYVQNNYGGQGLIGAEPLYKKYAEMYGVNFADSLYCYKTELRSTAKCQEFNNFWYSFNWRTDGDYPRYLTNNYFDEVRKWNAYQNISEITPLDEGLIKPSPEYVLTRCAVSLDKDYYLPGDEVLIKYTNAPADCRLTVTGAGGGGIVKGNGEIKSTAGSGGTIKAEISCGACYALDDAPLKATALNKVMSKAFMITPYLEDVRGNSRWTQTGNGTLYSGTGFERYDTCALSCDAKKDCHLFKDCTDAMGVSTECNFCDKTIKRDFTNEQCTLDSQGKCPGDLGDCWNKICKADTRPFTLEAPVGGSNFYTIPYKGSCPDVPGFSVKNMPLFVRRWVSLSDSGGGGSGFGDSGGFGGGGTGGRSGDATGTGSTGSGTGTTKPSGTSDKKCVLDGGVLGVTNFEFMQPSTVDVAFLIDTSPSMDDEWTSLCSIINNVVDSSAEKGVSLSYTVYALGEKIPSSSSGCKNRVLLPCSKINADLSGFIDCINCRDEGCQTESWGAGVMWAAKKHSWNGNAKKIIIPISDEDSDCGDSAGSDGWLRIKETAASANTGGINVYGLYGNEGSATLATVRRQMEELSKQTGGKASLFSTPEDMTNWLIKMATEADDTTYALANSKPLIKNKVASNVWEFIQEPEDINNAKNTGIKIVETGNMPFEVLYATLTKENNKYILTKVYKPDDSSRRFTAKSDIDFNYTLLENANSFYIGVNTTYRSTARRDLYYSSCSYHTSGSGCECSCSNQIYTYSLLGGQVGSCGGTSTDNQCVLDYDDEGNCIGTHIVASSRTEKETKTVDIEYSESDSIYVPQVSKKDICRDTLKELSVEGTLYQSVDDNGALTVYSMQDNPLKITISPDILGGFSFDVASSYINYAALIYPAKHELTATESSGVPDYAWSNYNDNYDYANTAFIPAQCQKTCPGEPMCKCSAENNLGPKCINLLQPRSGPVSRTDCACISQGCYKDYCKSERNYHEWEGSTIVNGDFETGNLAPFVKSGGIIGMITNTADVELGGYSGYGLKLEGAVEQNIPSLHVKPYNELCLEYAVNENQPDGYFNAILTGENGEKTINIWTYSDKCVDCTGWKKKCFAYDDVIKKIKLESTAEVYVDNVNFGAYYDFASPYTFETSNLEYMDIPKSNWNAVGLLASNGVTHKANTYSFIFKTTARNQLDPKYYPIKENIVGVINELDGGDATSVVKILNDKGEKISESATAQKTGEGVWVLKGTGSKNDYKINYFPNTGDLSIYVGKQKIVAFTPTDIRSGSITLETFFGPVEIPLAENKKEGEACYELNLDIRDPTKINLGTDPSGYSIPLGKRVSVTAQLTKLDGTPIAGEKIYPSLEGADLWKLSPEGINRDFLFNFNEITKDTNQQTNLKDLLKYLGYADIAASLDGATYRLQKEGVLNITSGGKGEIALITTSTLNGGYSDVNMNAGCGETIYLGYVNNDDKNSKPYTVYETSEQAKRGILVTGSDGSATFSFVPSGTTTLTVNYFGLKESPSRNSIILNTVGVRSPLLSGEFIVLMLILIFAVFSYRFFKDKRIDFGSWWHDFRGKK